jgi:hypothetical protein
MNLPETQRATMMNDSPEYDELSCMLEKTYLKLFRSSYNTTDEPEKNSTQMNMERIAYTLSDESVLTLNVYGQSGTILIGIGTITQIHVIPGIRELFSVLVFDEDRNIVAYHLWDGKVKEKCTLKDIKEFARELLDFVGEENRQDLGNALITLYDLIKRFDKAAENFDESSEDLDALLKDVNEHIIWYHWQTFVSNLLIWGGLLLEHSVLIRRYHEHEGK